LLGENVNTSPVILKFKHGISDPEGWGGKQIALEALKEQK